MIVTDSVTEVTSKHDCQYYVLKSCHGIVFFFNCILVSLFIKLIIS